MTYSLNEVEAMAKKAARGAGYAWGIAEETGKAVRWLESNGLPGAAALAGHLKNGGIDGPPAALDGIWTSTTGVLCPLTSGAALNDCAETLADGHVQHMDNVDQPLLIVPFAAWAAIHLSRPVAICWQGLRIGTDGDAIWIADPDCDITARQSGVLTCRIDTARADTARTPGFRADVPADVWAVLDGHAHRIYAPATEASRLLGAGTGGSDND